MGEAEYLLEKKMKFFLFFSPLRNILISFFLLKYVFDPALSETTISR
jgi:hypothetical protein